MAGEDSSIRVMYMYIWCLHREGGGGQKADAVRKLSKGDCVKMQTGGKSQETNPKILSTSYVHGPYVSRRPGKNVTAYLNHLPEHGVARDDVLFLLRLNVIVVQGHQCRQAHLKLVAMSRCLVSSRSHCLQYEGRRSYRQQPDLVLLIGGFLFPINNCIYIWCI